MTGWRVKKLSAELLLHCERILADIPYRITLRQLFFLLVSDGVLSNSHADYQRLKALTGRARKHGRLPIDIFSGVDDKAHHKHCQDPAELLSTLADNYRLDRMTNQPNYIEVWVDTVEMRTFVESVLADYDIPVYCTRGVSTFSFNHGVVERLTESLSRSGLPRVLYLTDFSPTSLNYYNSHVVNLAKSLDLTVEECSNIIVRLCVLPEHIVKYDLQITKTLSSSKDTELFESSFGDLLEAVGLPRIPLVEIESMHPSDLTECLYNAILSVLDQSEMVKLAELEDQHRQYLKDRIIIDD